MPVYSRLSTWFVLPGISLAYFDTDLCIQYPFAIRRSSTTLLLSWTGRISFNVPLMEN